MITRSIAGLQWEVISPSFYQLVGVPQVDLSYVGEVWFVHCPGENGQPKMRPFKTRDKAAALVASAFSFGSPTP